MIASRLFDAAGDCLVTGATGLVGNNVVRMLVGQGRSVRVLVRRSSAVGDKAFAGLPLTHVAGGLDDERALQDAVDGAACVIHSAAMVHCGWKHLAEMREVNVEGTRRIARAARRAGAGSCTCRASMRSACGPMAARPTRRRPPAACPNAPM
jgi:nucleoside-diphosphate-sugar epimerase